MAERKTCTKCGYTSAENDQTCPICGGHMSGGTAFSSHNATVEKKWNAGYHNDFEEGRKTGEYCDEQLEKSINGGEHYHGSVKQSFSEETSDETAVFLQRVTLAIQFAISFMPLIGYILCYSYVKKNQEMTIEMKRKIVILTIAATIIKYFLYLSFFLV